MKTINTRNSGKSKCSRAVRRAPKIPTLVHDGSGVWVGKRGVIYGRRPVPVKKKSMPLIKAEGLMDKLLGVKKN